MVRPTTLYIALGGDEVQVLSPAGAAAQKTTSAARSKKEGLRGCCSLDLLRSGKYTSGGSKAWLDWVSSGCTLTELQIGYMHVYDMHGLKLLAPIKISLHKFLGPRHGPFRGALSLAARQLGCWARGEQLAGDSYNGDQVYYFFKWSVVTGASCWCGTWGRYCGWRAGSLRWL